MSCWVCGRNWVLLQQVGLSRVIPHRRLTQRENLLALKIGAIQLPHAPGQHPKRVPIHKHWLLQVLQIPICLQDPQIWKATVDLPDILHQLIDGLSHYLWSPVFFKATVDLPDILHQLMVYPTIYRISTILSVVQDLFHQHILVPQERPRAAPAPFVSAPPPVSLAPRVWRPSPWAFETSWWMGQ